MSNIHSRLCLINELLLPWFLLQVTLTIALHEGAQFWDSGGRSRTETLCMQEHETQTIYVEVEFNDLGNVRIHGKIAMT